MANVNPIYVGTITAKGTTWTNSDAAATKKTISPTIGANGSRVHRISATSDDTVARDFQLFLNDGSTDFLVGTVPVTIGAGNTGSAGALSLTSFPVLSWVSTDGSILIPAGWILKAMNVTQPTAGKTFTFVVHGGNY